MSPRSQEQQMVPDAGFRSYYGRPVLKEPAWKTPDVPIYLFLGGLAGASSALAAAYGPLAGASAVSAVTGKLPRAGRAAAAVAGAMGPVVATYTAALICSTAVPAWHDAHREMPYKFAGSAAAAAAGIGLLVLPPDRAVPAARLAIAGAVAEQTAERLLERRLGAVAEPYKSGRAGKLMLAARVLSATGVAAVLAARGRGRASARDPKYTDRPAAHPGRRARLAPRVTRMAPPRIVTAGSVTRAADPVIHERDPEEPR